jgi:hypothetical protein
MMDTSVLHVRKITNVIINSNVQDKESYFRPIYENFATKYPFLFEMCCKPNVDKDTLEMMLSMLEKIKNNKMTQDKASEDIGQHLFNKYVDVSKLKKSDKSPEENLQITTSFKT